MTDTATPAEAAADFTLIPVALNAVDASTCSARFNDPFMPTTSAEALARATASASPTNSFLANAPPPDDVNAPPAVALVASLVEVEVSAPATASVEASAAAPV